jgi:CheY-like chemotaxis protein
MSKTFLIREGRTAEILLVEDNRGDAMLAARAFKEASIANNLRHASTGEQAMAMLRGEGEYAGQRLPDIILLDLNLPKMDGRAVLTQIKADDRLRHIPVLVLSSSVAEQDIAKSYNLHASAYVVKPLDLDTFRQVVSTIEQFFFFLVVLPDPDFAA